MKLIRLAKAGRLIVWGALMFSGSGQAADEERAGAARGEQTPSVNATLTGISEGCEVTWADTDSFSGFMQPGWLNRASSTKLIITSDPQPFFEESESGWNLIMRQFGLRINSARSDNDYIPLIINGDITNYGHGNERKAFRQEIQRFRDSQPGPLMLPGLGNHDYQGNVNDCANNGCARDAVCDQIIWTKAIAAATPGMKFDHHYSPSQRRHTGSLAYSLDIGMLHIVQLNLEPTYTVSFSTGGVGVSGEKTYFDISSSMSWLKRDLESAKARGQYTIINMHRYNGWKDPAIRSGEFSKLIADNKVIALFAGDLHDQLGYKQGAGFGKVPLFHSGAILKKTWLRVLLDWNESVVQVDSYKDLDHVQEYKYNIDTFQNLTPVPEKKVKVTIFAERNFAGANCTFELAAGGYQEIARGCLLRTPVASIKVVDFGFSGRSLCLSEKYEFSNRRCYSGDYVGNFDAASLSSSAGLPENLRWFPIGAETRYNWLRYD